MTINWEIQQAISQGGRNSQQDSIAVLHSEDGERHLLILADGMGGHKGGDLASQEVVKVAKAEWLACQQGAEIEKPHTLLKRIFVRAHEQINALGKAHQLNPPPSSTGVLLYIDQKQAWWSHIGDSRLYYFRGKKLNHRTKDHSVVQMLVDLGRIEESQMATHPDQGRLLKGLGGGSKEAIEPDFASSDSSSGDLFVICSDGFWEQIRPEVMTMALDYKNKDLSSSLQVLLNKAKKKGGSDGDNLSVLTARAPGNSFNLKYLLSGLSLVLLLSLLGLWSIFPATEKPQEQSKGRHADVTEPHLQVPAQAQAQLKPITTEIKSSSEIPLVTEKMESVEAKPLVSNSLISDPSAAEIIMDSAIDVPAPEYLTGNSIDNKAMQASTAKEIENPQKAANPVYQVMPEANKNTEILQNTGQESEPITKPAKDNSNKPVQTIPAPVQVQQNQPMLSNMAIEINTQHQKALHNKTRNTPTTAQDLVQAEVNTHPDTLPSASACNFTYEQNRNRILCYKSVLSRAPGNQVVIQELNKLFAYFQGKIDFALKENKLDEAKTLLKYQDEILSILPAMAIDDSLRFDVADKKNQLNTQLQQKIILEKQEKARQIQRKYQQLRQEKIHQAQDEAKWQADKRQALEAKRQADKRQALEAKRQADKRQALEAKRQADKRQAQEAKRQADKRQAQEAKRQADKRQAREARRQADKRQALEAKRQADKRQALEAEKKQQEQDMEELVFPGF
ncbi:protein phosphatase 2C domain-containing protein [Candidatus Venteria ishoeyi]|uniref:Serine/threonine phosphatase stp n=1 Tax=Candidatus Venteria ishoeyi TaxID=1899563 RepID=A0A1H6F450_9GAMM|nr:protein phosphatase 2C domain-containing protein [Candidatus Venteria ishoeyi]SEH04872.1 Serine/threonine phosphatase stp [Candidatus Venteria ishoeyi]